MRPYFSGPISSDFLKYFSMFRSVAHFSEHVGRPCSMRWVRRMKKRFVCLQSAREEAKKNMDFELLAEIEMGKFKLE